MRKILVLLGALFIIASCTMDDGPLKMQVEFLPALSVEAPKYMTPGGTYEFKVKYKRPTDCYYFDGFYYEPEGDLHMIAVQALVIKDAECQSLESLEPEEATFEVSCSPLYTQSNYVFKFYKGVDEDGNQLFLEVDIPVQQ